MALNAKIREEAKAKAAEAGGAGAGGGDDDFDPNADLSKMSLPEQL